MATALLDAPNLGQIRFQESHGPLHFNPHKHGDVRQVADWPYSTFSQVRGDGRVASLPMPQENWTNMRRNGHRLLCPT